MLTEYDSPQSRALFRLLIGAAENAKASKHNSRSMTATLSGL
jgi:hypothetical protein